MDGGFGGVVDGVVGVGFVVGDGVDVDDVVVVVVWVGEEDGEDGLGYVD